jgi:glycosyltransferase involved in cell wall biosynthesis
VTPRAVVMTRPAPLGDNTRVMDKTRAVASSEVSPQDRAGVRVGARCLLVVPGPIDRVTGGSIYDRRIADHLVERGMRVEVASVPDLPYFAGLMAGVAVSVWLMARLVVRRYDLLIEDGWSHPSLALFNLLCRRPRVVIVHQLRRLETKNPAAKAVVSAIERASLKSARLIITVSRYMRGEIERLTGGDVNVVVASPGCDADGRPAAGARQPEGAAAGMFRLLFVGNCMRRKGLDHLIRALAMLEGLPVRLDVVGGCDFEPGYCEQLRREVYRLRLAGAVTFHGRVSSESLAEFYRRADLFVMPSLYEGFGIVYAEAMRAGLPIVATAVGPVPEIARDGENALLVPPADPHALAEAIRMLVSDAGLRARLARRSAELAADLPTWQGACEAVYQSLASVISHSENASR